MKKVLTILFILINALCYPQTIKVEIDAQYVAFCEFHNKAFVAVSIEDVNYPKNLVQLDPYSGNVEKCIPLSGDPKKILFTPDYAHLYVSYYTLPQIDKVNLTDFQITATINVGYLNVIDFAVSPLNENILFVVLGNGVYPEKIVMYINSVLQPKQIDDFHMDASYLCIKSDGTRLYGHNGYSTGFQGYLIEVVEDGIVYNGIGWRYMIASFGEIKIHNNLVFGNGGHVVDPFTDTIPLMEAIMPVYKLTDSRPGFDYSELHGCYVYGHETDYKGYISFFHGQYYNYLGSLQVIDETNRISDVDVVDESHFILVSYDGYPDYKNSLLLYTIEGKMKPIRHNTNGDCNKDWFENKDIIKSSTKDDSIHLPL